MTSNPDSEWQDASSSTLDTSDSPIKSTHLPTTEERLQELRKNCALRSVANGLFGGGLGFAAGLLRGGSEDPAMQDKMTGRQKLIYRAKLLGRTSWPSCRNFAIVGFMFAATECMVEKARGERDIANVAVAGCVTGGAVYAKAGPKAACQHVLAVLVLLQWRPFWKSVLEDTIEEPTGQSSLSATLEAKMVMEVRYIYLTDLLIWGSSIRTN